MPIPDLTIIIVNFNSGDFLSGTLESIRKHPPSNDWHVIIVDNCSKDDSFNKARMIVDSDPRFDFIEAEDNLGFAAGNNLAISRSSGRLILLLNPDTCVTGEAIDRLIYQIDGNSDYGAVGPRLVSENGSNTVSFGWLPTARGILSD
ncbi:glycosyltransferase, partial [bacterium]|nr:glycosyltransferase [bacterium]MBU1025919.1 glycosyltransferase [bacterium]